MEVDVSDRHLKCGSYWALATRAIAAAMLAALAAIAPAQAGGVSVLTYHNDNSRTGWNPNETELTPTNVNASQFGLIFRVLLDGNVFAQPLYVPQVTIAGAPHNVVVAATENASVYAIDADTGAVLWRHAFPSSPSIRPASATCDCLSECYGKGPQGLTGTPTIDVGLDSIYVVARTNEYHGTHYVNYQLHALSIKSGADRVTPRLIELSAVATGGVTVRLSPKCNLQRPGLAEANGNIYVAFGSEGDQQPATTTGWLAAYDAQTLGPSRMGPQPPAVCPRSNT